MPRARRDQHRALAGHGPCAVVGLAQHRSRRCLMALRTTVLMPDQQVARWIHSGDRQHGHRQCIDLRERHVPHGFRLMAETRCYGPGTRMRVTQLFAGMGSVTILVLVLIGALTGLTTVLFGFGGGFVTVPVIV